MRCDGDCAHRGDHEADRDKRHATQVPANVAEVGEEGGSVHQQRKEDDEDDARVELDFGDARDEPEQGPGDHEQDRIGHRHAPGERAQAGDGHEHAGYQQFGLSHLCRV